MGKGNNGEKPASEGSKSLLHNLVKNDKSVIEKKELNDLSLI